MVFLKILKYTYIKPLSTYRNLNIWKFKLLVNLKTPKICGVNMIKIHPVYYKMYHLSIILYF